MGTQTMRERVTAELEQRITNAGLDPVAATEWANTGTLHAMRGIESVIQIGYEFHSTYCQLTFTGAPVVAAAIPDSPPLLRREGDRVRFYNLNYTDTPRLGHALDLVTSLISQRGA
jgi:hypothetical protein